VKRGLAPLAEITLRKYETPTKGNRRELIKRFCLSVGLLNPGESRELIVDLFELFLNNRRGLTTAEIEEQLAKKHAISGIRRHIRRLIEIKLLEKNKRVYRLPEGNSLTYAVEYLAKRYVVDEIYSRIVEYAKILDES